MKKFLIICALLFAGAAAFAESDLQFTTQALSLYQNKYITWNNRRYRESIAFEYSGNVFEITNHNYFWKGLGFYDSLTFMVKDTFGLGLALGPCFKVYDGKSTQMTISTGVHSTFYSIDYIEFGVETDFRVKFLKDRRFSPVAGLCLSFDFATNGNALDVLDSGINTMFSSFVKRNETVDNTIYERSVYEDYSLDKFFAFYVMPYVAFSINF